MQAIFDLDREQREIMVVLEAIDAATGDRINGRFRVVSAFTNDVSPITNAIEVFVSEYPGVLVWEVNPLECNNNLCAGYEVIFSRITYPQERRVLYANVYF